jgi:hypothetical protein
MAPFFVLGNKVSAFGFCNPAGANVWNGQDEVLYERLSGNCFPSRCARYNHSMEFI